MPKPDPDKLEKISKADVEAILAKAEAWLESINAAERTRRLPEPFLNRPRGRKPMTLSQKIFAHHVIGYQGPDVGLQTGDVVRVSVDWVIASEISWIVRMPSLQELD